MNRLPSFRLLRGSLPGVLIALLLALGCADVGPDVGGLVGEVARQRQVGIADEEVGFLILAGPS